MTAAYQESREMSKYGGEQERCAIRLHVIHVIDATSRFPATEPAVRRDDAGAAAPRLERERDRAGWRGLRSRRPPSSVVRAL